MSTRLGPRSDARVLVVDDDLAVRFLAREALEDAGFKVEEAEDGPSALTSFSTKRPDIVLLDVMMVEMDGFATCSALRNTPGGSHTPVLMMTGLNDIESINRAYEAGATDFVSKPINWAILTHRIRYMLRASAALQGIKASETRLANAQRIARLGNWDWNIRQNTWEASDECCQIFGLTSLHSNLTYQAFLAGIHPGDRDFVATARDRALKEGGLCSIEYRVVWPDGEQRIVHEQAEAQLDSVGRPLSMTGTVQDITERKQAEEKIRYLAYYDTLTGLPNRQSFKKDLKEALDLARRCGQLMAVLFLDLDNFKRINDTLGHTIGDLLLKAIADRLLNSIRTTDWVGRPRAEDTAGNVARLGGDEFTVLLNDIRHIEDAATVARRIQEILAHPLKLGGHEVVTTSSVGIAVFPHDGKNVDQLLKNADTAMYHAKAAGRDVHKFYSESMSVSALERLKLESRLRRALEQEELLLFYQPKVDLRSGNIVGMEALLRWHNPDMGCVSPTEFIPLAEDTGLIIAIGNWLVRTACTQNRFWQTAGFPPMRVAINLSSLQFRQRNLTTMISRALTDTGLEPKYLELELTESIIMHNLQETVEVLHELKNMGLGLSVDDFGTGYSSLSYLKRFPLDTVKIDQSFVKDIIRDPDDAAITTAIIAMAHSLKLKVIAEGVETEQQLAFLRENHCDEIQGFLFSKPMPADEFTQLLEQWEESAWCTPGVNQRVVS